MIEGATVPNPMLFVLDRYLTREELIDALAAVPEQLRSTLDGAGVAALTRSDDSGAWSAFQYLCHMRDAAIVYSARFRWMAFDDDPVLPSFDENRWVESAVDGPGDVPDILGFFEATREDLIRVLSRMPGSAWLRTGRHDVAGSIVLEDYVRHQLAHEEGHLRDIRVAMER